MAGCNEEKKAETAAPALTTQEQKVGYAIGAQIGAQLAMTKEDIDSKALVAGLTDAMNGTELKLTDQQMQEAKMAFQKKVQEKAQKEMMELAEKNKAEGEKFLAENKTKEGVVTLPSGLQYKVVQAGTGATPTATDTVVTHYTGTLINGQVFDSSVQRGEPATFPVNGVIAGWTEALQHMKVGAKWQLFIPAELAYGERGAGQTIAPNSTLIFDIELLEIKK
ncbi:FKBP-type peptidyl-prolyl cis-trans isomerase [Sulfurimonas sp. HSL3-7]